MDKYDFHMSTDSIIDNILYIFKTKHIQKKLKLKKATDSYLLNHIQ